LSNATSSSASYSGASVIGISQKSKVAGQTIAGNTIFNLSNTNTGSVFVHNYGIYYSGPSTGTNTVSRNFIYNLTVAATNTAAVINGIRTEWGVTTYSNNIINLGSGLVIGYEVGGIFDDAGGNQASSFYYNTVYLGGTVIGAGSSTFAFSALLYATKSINLRNNIFYNGRSGGSAGMHYAIKLPGTTGLTIDYNDYYVPEPLRTGHWAIWAAIKPRQQTGKLPQDRIRIVYSPIRAYRLPEAQAPQITSPPTLLWLQ
jgi:hypothetical protein